MNSVLITNDDGIDSPLLPPFLEVMAAWKPVKDLRFVIPDTERSWVSQAATRFDEVSVESHQVKYHDKYFEGFRCSGTPADCSSLGIYNLYQNKPDLLLSGINIGANAGLTFYLFSGTVGAARTGFLSGVPSMALSVNLPPDVFEEVHQDRAGTYEKYADDWARICSFVPICLDRLMQISIFDYAALVNINFPWEVGEGSKIKLTGIERNSKGRMFNAVRPGIFKHQFQGLFTHPDQEDHLMTDIEALKESAVSVTPINYVFGRDITRKTAELLSGKLD